MIQKFTALLLVLCLGLLSSCYVIEIQQGNVIDPAKVAQLKIGMSKEQVRYVMGTPILQSTFNDDKWDYVYTLRDHKHRYSYKHVGMVFKNNQLVSIDKQ